MGLVTSSAAKTKGGVHAAQLYDRFEPYLRTLESKGVKTDKYAALLFPVVESGVPEKILRV